MSLKFPYDNAQEKTQLPQRHPPLNFKGKPADDVSTSHFAPNSQMHDRENAYLNVEHKGFERAKQSFVSLHLVYFWFSAIALLQYLNRSCLADLNKARDLSTKCLHMKCPSNNGHFRDVIQTGLCIFILQLLSILGMGVVYLVMLLSSPA